MDLLLDTHALIWFADEPEKLSARAYDAIVDESNRVFISVASVWELQIKMQLGKLSLDLPLPELVKTQETENDMTVLPVRLPHVYGLNTLPPHHRDPFDRLMISQAITECLKLVSVDGCIQSYSDVVDLYW